MWSADGIVLSYGMDSPGFKYGKEQENVFLSAASRELCGSTSLLSKKYRLHCAGI
jgi:hypothetical protein